MARDRIRRDTAGVGPDPDMAGRLYRLGDANFKIADGEPDVRGWQVRTLAGNHVGEVDDLLIDPHRSEVVMLEVDLENSDRRARIPIRGVQLDRDRKCVVVDSGDVATAHPVDHDEIDDLRDDDVRDDARLANARRREDRMITDDDVREVRYARPAESEEADEVVVERRPVIEEIVVRRRVVDTDELDELDERD